MENNSLIYVAGNPDAYPLEYYDPVTGTYQGVIPQLLEQFSAQSGYQVVYYAPGQTDQRSQLAHNLQVDLLSGYTQDDQIPGGDEILLFQAICQGQEHSYYLGATAVAPESLKADLTDFFSSVPQQAVTGALLDAAAIEPPAPSVPFRAAVGVALALAVLAAAAVTAACRYRKKLQEARRELTHDKNTGLGNRSRLERYYQQTVDDKNRILYNLLYFYVDTDHLRRQAGSQEINDILRYCADVLGNHTAQTDILAQTSENSFALLQFSGDPKHIQAWAGPVLEKIRAYPAAHGKPFAIDIAVGVYPLAMGSRELDEMISYARQEALRALAAQKDILFFTRDSLNRIQLEQKLRATVARALDSNEYQLYIQFYVDAQTHRIVGGEALSRWFHPEQGLLLPKVFVPALERCGLIDKLDYHCLRSSCKFLQELCDHGICDFFLSCNFSRDTFAGDGFVEQCKQIIGAFSFPRELLIFELTESVCTEDLAAIRSNMLALKEYGIRIALDDFGEGFTSFSDLQECPVDGVKLDKGLVGNVLTKKANAILRAVIQVGHEMGLTMLAEGVETEAQAQALQAIHCDVLQGYHFYAPAPQAQARDKLLAAAQPFRR